MQVQAAERGEGASNAGAGDVLGGHGLAAGEAERREGGRGGECGDDGVEGEDFRAADIASVPPAFDDTLVAMSCTVDSAACVTTDLCGDPGEDEACERG